MMSEAETCICTKFLSCPDFQKIQGPYKVPQECPKRKLSSHRQSVSDPSKVLKCEEKQPTQPENKTKNEPLDFDLDKVLEAVLRLDHNVGTPILTNAVSYQNKLAIKVEKALKFQELAQKAESTALQRLVVRSTKLQAKFRNSANKKGLVDLEGDVYIYLNGSGKSFGKSVSVCVELREVPGKQHVPEYDRLIVSLFVKPKNDLPDEDLRRRSFSMKVSDGKKGVLDFISKDDLATLVDEEGSVTFGITVTCD